MARGWESKSVESQMEAAAARRAPERKIPPHEEQLREEQLRKQRERESLLLSRKRVLRDIETATHARYREQLEAALKHLDSRLKELE
jgi:hypothetical protein